MEFSEVIKSRYSVRQFDPRPVEPEKISYILELARLAPTAVDKQPQRILVLQSPDDMAKLAKCTNFTFGAPAAFVVAEQEDAAWVRPYDQENSGIIDASIVGAFLMLAIHNLDLGTCWVGHFDPREIRKVFNFPRNFRPVAVFPFGYPAADAKPSGLHDRRLPMDDLVWHNHF